MVCTQYQQSNSISSTIASLCHIPHLYIHVVGVDGKLSPLIAETHSFCSILIVVSYLPFFGWLLLQIHPFQLNKASAQLWIDCSFTCVVLGASSFPYPYVRRWYIIIGPQRRLRPLQRLNWWGCWWNLGRFGRCLEHACHCWSGGGLNFRGKNGEKRAMSRKKVLLMIHYIK